MTKAKQPAFRETQVFDWASEPNDERPSEFKSSTGYAVLSAFDPSPDSRLNRPPARRAAGGMVTLVVAIVGVVGLGIAALWGYLHLLRS